MFLALNSILLFQDTPLDDQLALGDIIEPDPIPFSFDTVGWKIVFILIALLIAYVSYRLYLNYKKKLYLRKAINAVQNLSQKEIGTVDFIYSVLFILKDTAIQTFGRQEVASLKGKQWLLFLDSKVAHSDFISQEAFIYDAIYKNEIKQNTSFNKEEFSSKSINWIRKHAR